MVQLLLVKPTPRNQRRQKNHLSVPCFFIWQIQAAPTRGGRKKKGAGKGSADTPFLWHTGARMVLHTQHTNSFTPADRNKQKNHSTFLSPHPLSAHRSTGLPLLMGKVHQGCCHRGCCPQPFQNFIGNESSCHICGRKAFEHLQEYQIIWCLL